MERNLRKERIGIVVSNKMDKSIVVAVATKEKHPIYEQDKELEISRNSRKS